MGDVKKMLEKKQKKKKTSEKLDRIDASLQECYANLPSPKFSDTLPYRVGVWMLGQLTSLPSTIKNALNKKPIQDENEQEDAAAAAQLLAEQEYQRRKAQTSRLHKELNPTKIEKSDSAAPVITYNLAKSQTNSDESITDVKTTENGSSKEWTDKQKTDLIKVHNVISVYIKLLTY